jgi:pantoate--beta-alanine ligase
MDVAHDRASLAGVRARLQSPLGLVPTMGALHDGHRALIRRCRAECASVVTSIFVNPTQFGPGEDFEGYPRDEAADLATCEAEGVDAVFAPHIDAMYPAGAVTHVEVGALGNVLEGTVRPGHFGGVATVVTVLLSLVRPDRAYFGQKDGQQSVVVQRLVRDLGMPVQIVIVPTVREPDGLALSSRNAYLGPAERAAAPVLRRALRAAVAAYDAGERDAARLRELMRAELASEPLATADYVSVADSRSLVELVRVDGPALLSLAVRFPSARLIDCELIG